MKIKKEKKIILEAVDLNEADEETVQKQLDNAAESGEVPADLSDATVADVAAEIQQGAKEDGKEISAKDAVKEAKAVFEATDLIRNPYGGAKLGTINQALQDSLDDMLDQRFLNDFAEKETGEAAIGGDFPNVLIYGSAGFAKTGLVKRFCKDHGLNLFPLDAKTLDLATVSGIPYPKKDPKTGELTQIPIASKIWQSLDLPNTVIFLDELNRANGRIRGTLLTLINEHILPIAVEEEDGTVKVEKFFPNILFTVSAVNPASDLYRDANDLDIAELSRNASIVKQEASVKEFYSYIDELYKSIEKLQDMDKNNTELQRILDKYAGQGNIARALLLDKGFEFDDDEDNRQNIRNGKKEGKIYNSLNYRTFFLTLKKTNGTKDGYIRSIENQSGFSPTRIAMIKNILATYSDKPTTGNTVWNQPSTNSQKARAARAAVETAKALDDFAKML